MECGKSVIPQNLKVTMFKPSLPPYKPGAKAHRGSGIYLRSNSCVSSKDRVVTVVKIPLLGLGLCGSICFSAFPTSKMPLGGPRGYLQERNGKGKAMEAWEAQVLSSETH